MPRKKKQDIVIEKYKDGWKLVEAYEKEGSVWYVFEKSKQKTTFVLIGSVWHDYDQLRMLFN